MHYSADGLPQIEAVRLFQTESHIVLLYSTVRYLPTVWRLSTAYRVQCLSSQFSTIVRCLFLRKIQVRMYRYTYCSIWKFDWYKNTAEQIKTGALKTDKGGKIRTHNKTIFHISAAKRTDIQYLCGGKEQRATLKTILVKDTYMFYGLITRPPKIETAVC
jgi:hypothetical protein